uniref:hypothetical protein n=1 Tax=Bradyrhizobium sp. (strain ORS 278) TaxID=114615 RepID=UPI0003176640|nr:hypothetical protein [Bradyrhizobium sp. ORS 278]
MPITIAGRIVVIALALLVACATAATNALCADSSRAYPTRHVADGRLWLLAGGGRLSQIAEARAGRRRDATRSETLVTVISVSFDVPDIVLLLITGTQGRSPNSGASMMVPR